MGVGEDVESFHSGELVPLSNRVLVPFDVFPNQWEREAAGDLEDFMDNIIFGAEACSGENGGRSEACFDAQDQALVVGGDADPGYVWGEYGERNIVELVVGDEEGLDEDEEGELADAFRAKRVGKPPGCGAAAFPEDEVVGGNDPAKGASVSCGAAVGAPEQ
jgi:hypothetical protein